MQRNPVEPRPDWKTRLEAIGFDFHTVDGRRYWDESAEYVFSPEEIDVLAKAGEELHRRALEATDHVIRHGLWRRVGIPEKFGPLVAKSRERDDPGLIGRFDFSWDGTGAPKMLEYNADTPTSLPESAVVQKRWLAEKHPGAKSFDTIREKLAARWRPFAGRRVHFHAYTRHREDELNLAFHERVAASAGVVTGGVSAMSDIAWDSRRGVFVDSRERAMETVFKLYPWEWLFREPFGEHLLRDTTRWIEPPWKAVLTSKGLLPVLWELFPEHPNLLPAYESPENLRGDFAKKPILSREGANITLVKNGSVFRSSDGRYGAFPCIRQALHELPDFAGNRPVFGVWIVGDEACGLSVREDTSPITGRHARFVPHRMA